MELLLPDFLHLMKITIKFMCLFPDNQFVSIWYWFSPSFLSTENPFSSFMRKSMEKILYERRGSLLLLMMCCKKSELDNAEPTQKLKFRNFLRALFQIRKIIIDKILSLILRNHIYNITLFATKYEQKHLWEIFTKEKLYHH